MSEPLDPGPGSAAATVDDLRARLAVCEQELDEIVEFQQKLDAAQDALEQSRTRSREARDEFAASVQPLTREHPLRRLLLEDAAAVALIHGDLHWQRLVVLLYGGLPDLHLADFVRQYREIAAVLQLPDSSREGAINQLRARPYWRESWDSEDVVYSLAVYLDTVCGARLNEAKTASPVFDPLFICLDSVLTPFLIPRLREGIPGHALADPLRELARRHNVAQDRASAILALLALDPASMYDEVVELSRGGDDGGVARALLNLVRQRLTLLGDGVVLHAAATRLDGELERIQELLPPEKREDLVAVVYRSWCAELPGPPPPGDLVRWMELPYVSAEVWGTWLSGVGGDDAKYSFAVVLDTIGGKISSAVGISNLYRARAATFQQVTSWTLDPLPPVWRDMADMYGEALTIAHQSASLVLEDLFHSGIVNFPGRELRLGENPDLVTDALAATLLLPDTSIRPVLEELDPALAARSYYDVERQVAERVARVADPVLHARALWRILHYRLLSGDARALEAAEAAAARIESPMHRVRAYERLAKDVPVELREGLLEPLRTAVRDIPDANNRVRALCRLALLTHPDEGVTLFHEAVGEVGSIVGDAERSDTLLLMRNLLREQQFAADALDEVAETEADPWYRHKGMGLSAFELVSLHPQLKAPAAHTALVLHAVLSDVAGLLERTREQGDAWRRLTSREQRATAFASLLASVAASPSGVLPLDRGVCAALGALAADGGSGMAAALLPHLELPRGRRVAEVHEWLQHPPHEVFRPYANLIAAEAGHLDGTTVPYVLDLLQHGRDIARYRAALVLHGTPAFIGKLDPRHRASLLGTDAILRISDFSIRMREQGLLGAANAANWTWVNVLFDSPAVLDDLVRCIENDPQRRPAAEKVLSSLALLSETSQARFLDLLLAHTGGPAAGSLLQGFCSLSNPQARFSVPKVREAAVAAYWNSLPDELQESVRGLPDRIANVLHVIVDCVEQSGEAVPVETLEARLLECTIKASESLPVDLSHCTTYWLSNDPPKAEAAAQQLAESAARLRALFSWLKATLANGLADARPSLRLRDTLLEIAGYCGRYSPATVFNLVEELELGALLSSAAIRQPHFNGRAGAVTLLGYVRMPGEGFLAALNSAIIDTAEVQQAALAMIRRLRYASPAILSEVIELLNSNDTAQAYTASRLLSVIARHERTSDADRRAILRALSSALKAETARYSVCGFESTAGAMWISNLGTLAQRHYQSLLEIVSLA